MNENNEAMNQQSKSLAQSELAGVLPAVLPFEQQPREPNKAFGAFKLYLDLGPARTVAAVAAKLGRHPGALHRWCAKYDWVGRVTAHNRHVSDLERKAIERVVCEQAVQWWLLHEPVRRAAWKEAEEGILMVREARQRWQKSDETPGFEGMARMLDMAFKLKQFATGMPREIKEVHNFHTAKVSIEWEEAIRKAYDVKAESASRTGNDADGTGTGNVTETIIDVQEVKP